MKKLNFAVVIIALSIMLFVIPAFANIVMDPPIDDYLEILNATWETQPTPNYDIGRIKLKIKIKQDVKSLLNRGYVQAVYIDKDGVELGHYSLIFYGSPKKGTIKMFEIGTVPYNTYIIKFILTR